MRGERSWRRRPAATSSSRGCSGRSRPPTDGGFQPRRLHIKADIAPRATRFTSSRPRRDDKDRRGVLNRRELSASEHYDNPSFRRRERIELPMTTKPAGGARHLHRSPALPIDADGDGGTVRLERGTIYPDVVKKGSSPQRSRVPERVDTLRANRQVMPRHRKPWRGT